MLAALTRYPERGSSLCLIWLESGYWREPTLLLKVMGRRSKASRRQWVKAQSWGDPISLVAEGYLDRYVWRKGCVVLLLHEPGPDELPNGLARAIILRIGDEGGAVGLTG